MRILWIDDDGLLLESQERQIKAAGYEVRVIQTVDEAWKELCAPEPRIKGIILDVMMATGELLREQETNGGLRTGERFLEAMHREGFLGQYKLFIYTITENASTYEIAQLFKIPYYKKQSYPGKEIVSLITRHFGTP